MSTPELGRFQNHTSGCMEMYADAVTVRQYLDTHQDWFYRCAWPMTAEPLGETGYALTIGRFGALGFEVEPKIGLNLLPQEQGIYRIETIPVSSYMPQGYDVDFRAWLGLFEKSRGEEAWHAEPAQERSLNLPVITHVEWELDLDVKVQLPQFIQALPASLVQTTGDRLLNQIVHQVSRCLTDRVQENFHATLGIPFPRGNTKKPLWPRLGIITPPGRHSGSGSTAL